jgi:hypothetical protein
VEDQLSRLSWTKVCLEAASAAPAIHAKSFEIKVSKDDVGEWADARE